MRSIVVLLALIALTVPSQAAPKARDDGASRETECRDMVGKETTEGEGRSHIGQFQAQRFGECMMGTRQ